MLRIPDLLTMALAASVVVLSSCTREGGSTTLTARADSLRADSIARAEQESLARAQPGYVVDSILPVDEELHRFRAALPGDSALAFTGGSGSREELVRRFIHALAASDTTDLRVMALRPREFSDLYYPESRFTHEPYRQSPALAWKMIQNPSSSGLTRLVRRIGGRPITYVSHRCEPAVAHEGRNVRYTGCLVRVVDERGDTLTKRYFGSIIERGGRYKFLSYTNQL